MIQISDLTPTQEDYLEVIYHLVSENSVARNKDIAAKLNVKRATVTGAIKALGEKGLLNYESHGFITLTKDGKAVAERIIERHSLLYHFFYKILGLEDVEANKIACHVEHVITDTALEKLKSLVEHIDSCSHDKKYRSN